MKSYYKLIVSDRPNLPFTLGVKFRSQKRAMQMMRYYHKQERDVLLAEFNDFGMVASWEMYAGNSLVIFDCCETNPAIAI